MTPRTLKSQFIRPEPVGTLDEQNIFYAQVSVRTALMERRLDGQRRRVLREDAYLHGNRKESLTGEFVSWHSE